MPVELESDPLDKSLMLDVFEFLSVTKCSLVNCFTICTDGWNSGGEHGGVRTIVL